MAAGGVLPAGAVRGEGGAVGGEGGFVEDGVERGAGLDVDEAART